MAMDGFKRKWVVQVQGIDIVIQPFELLAVVDNILSLKKLKLKIDGLVKWDQTHRINVSTEY